MKSEQFASALKVINDDYKNYFGYRYDFRNDAIV